MTIDWQEEARSLNAQLQSAGSRLEHALAAKDAEIERLTKERDEARAEIEDGKLENGYVIGWNSGWDEAFQRLKFPTMLRKMWSGGEVQRWLDERRAEQAGPIPGSLSERMFSAEARVAELEADSTSMREALILIRREQQSEAQAGTGDYQRGYDDCIAAHAEIASAALGRDAT